MSEDLSKVAILGDFRFPFGDAGSNRIFALAKALRDAGCRPVVISRGAPRLEDRLEDGRYRLEGIDYWAYTQLPAPSFFSRLRRPQHALAKEGRAGGLDAVLLYASTSWLFVPGILRYCRKHRLPLAADVVEWYEPSQYRFGIFDWHYFLFSRSFRLFFHRIKHLVVISRLLEGYFNKKGCVTARVPAIVDYAAVSPSAITLGGKLRLLYAGVPGRKDLILQALKGLLLFSDEELSRIEFNLLGPDDAQLSGLFGGAVPARLRNVMHAHGRVPLQVVSDWLLQSDFTVLLREDRRFSRAGFPSKVPESLAHGVPILCNMTGDMALYLQDGRDCIEAAAPTAEAFAAALRTALSLPAERLMEMKAAAQRCAETNFDYRNYIAAISGVLEGARAEMKAVTGR
jgi:glycosyltransferase involved in cell wall biosynthesis